MVVDVTKLIAATNPSNTVLLFGAGSSIPSHAPSVASLQERFESKFGEAAHGYSLAEQAGIIESKNGRDALIYELREAFKSVKPVGSILNLPLYDWKSIYTTNYDSILEDSYRRKNREFSVYSSNFDFGARQNNNAVQIFKVHGTIEKDTADGNYSRIIITESDYDRTSEYRDLIWDRFKSDIGASHLIIIGHSLADRHIKDLVDRALVINSKQGGSGKITIFSYERDEGRALLFENRGIEVCFGGLDDFFGNLAARIVPSVSDKFLTGDILDISPKVRPWTIDVAHSKSAKANVSAMFNGWPATYADIEAGYTFSRIVSEKIEGQLVNGESPYAVILGPSGVGKTTCARQALMKMASNGVHCWEHKLDQPLIAHEWGKVGLHLKEKDQVGCLFIDDAHLELPELNDLVNILSSDANRHLRIIACSTVGHWRHRIKASGLHKWGIEYPLNRIGGEEIDRLIRLVESVDAIRNLAEANFSGFSHQERRRRLLTRCVADMFVCLKFIFSNEKLDDIMLREYASLDITSREIYRVVAAMESAGVRVHRQLVIRILNIDAMSISGILDKLTDIIIENTEDEKQGIYAWRGRHEVIMSIIADHKYYDTNSRFELFDTIIESIQPTYDIEIRTIKGLCDSESGIGRIPDRRQQNKLLRKMISVAPRERIPRHRLIRNLIELDEYDAAEIELRLFEKDYRLDGPAARYKIDLAKARAIHSPGLMEEDRIVLLDKARELAAGLSLRFLENKSVLSAYCEVGIEIGRMSGDFTSFDLALKALKSAEISTSDGDITRRISKFEGQVARILRSRGSKSASQAQVEEAE